CPVGAPKTDQIDLKTADYEMMINSDNRMSHAIYDYFKNNAQYGSVDQTLSVLGLTDTKLQLFSCDRLTYPHSPTLRDMSAIYEPGYLGTDIRDQADRDNFLDNMDHGSWPSYLWQMTTDEAFQLGFSQQTKDAFYSQLAAHSMGKGGELELTSGFIRANSG